MGQRTDVGHVQLALVLAVLQIAQPELAQSFARVVGLTKRVSQDK